MFELFAVGDTLPDAYHAALSALHGQNSVQPCPDYGTRQREASMTFVARRPLGEPMISRLFIGDARALEQYRQEMLDGILDFEVDRGNWEYTYHRRMETQLGWAVDELRRNPDSRRAVISLRTDEDMHTGSPACLQSVHYLIRDGALHCKTLFRSNDAAKAAYMNAFALVMLQQRVAGELGVGVGTYTHRANSFHVYERDWPLFDAYAKRIQGGDGLTYAYAGDWDALMEDSKAEIEDTVRRLREGD
jgi:thymidylate synthase